ncbi:MAG: DpnI domain-containing protein [Mariprofundaceae bacterium]
MILNFDSCKANGYTNNAQVARVLSESWVRSNGYCPNCGADYLSAFINNKPVADFYCEACSEQFELKSKNGVDVGKKVVDGAYSTMINRINSEENPNFFFLAYDKSKLLVRNFMIVPKHYFVSDLIEKRKPLSSSARRAGWIGCNINLGKVPDGGKIYIVRNSQVIPKHEVYSKWKGTEFLKTTKGDAKGWVLDVMKCVDAMSQDVFSLKEMYVFEGKLRKKHPNNNYIKDKIRQQLQLLRDKGLIEFINPGVYKRRRHEEI